MRIPIHLRLTLGEAAALTHFVGEAPDVAQTDGGTDGCHQEAESGSPLTAFVFHKNSPLF